MMNSTEYRGFEIEDGCILKYRGFDKDIVIPDGITSIGKEAFKSSYIESLFIPNSVRTIGHGAFSDCKELRSLTIGSPRTDNEEVYLNLHSGVFYRCSSLKEIDIYVNLFMGGVHSAYRPFELVASFNTRANLRIHKGVKHVGDSVFRNFISLGNLELGPDVEYIGEYAFYTCYHLKEIHIPHKTSYIGKYAFYNCSDAESISIGDIGHKARDIFIDDLAFARAGRSDLNTIQIHNNISTVGNDIFSHFDGDDPIPDGHCVVLLMFEDDPRKEPSLSVVIGDTVENIADGTFSDISDLEKVIIGDGLEKISARLFNNCKKLTKVILGENVRIIMYDSFKQCLSLESIFLNKNFMKDTVPESAFLGTSTKIFYEGSEDMWNRNSDLEYFSERFKNFLVDSLGFTVNDALSPIGASALDDTLKPTMIYNCTKEMYDELNNA